MRSGLALVLLRLPTSERVSDKLPTNGLNYFDYYLSFFPPQLM